MLRVKITDKIYLRKSGSQSSESCACSFFEQAIPSGIWLSRFGKRCRLLLKHFHYQITQVLRVANSHADALARLASAVEDKIGRKIHVELLAALSTMVAEVCNLQQGDSWITPIYKFLAHGTLPNDKVQAKQIRYKSARYLIINDQLYKRGFTLPYLRCLTPAEAEIVLREIHEGVCGDHVGFRSLAHKTFRQIILLANTSPRCHQNISLM
ncbi:hypothetical protein ACFXTN_022092 [Malus domestica]